MQSSALEQMLADGLAETVTQESVDTFLAGNGLRVLLFSGLGGNRTEGHDVAVALRELLRDYAGKLRSGVVADDAERALMGRFRVAVLPTLVLVAGGQVLEVLPRVKDWADYAAAFQRYLGVPSAAKGATAERMSA